MPLSLRQLMESQGFERIPLKKLNSGHYKLGVQVNGRKGEFILDTGASSTCIGLDSIELFNLNNETSDVKAAGAGATNMITQLARQNTMRIRNKEIRGIDFVLFDLSHVNEALLQTHDVAINGILGADLLKQLRAIIDYGRNCVYIKIG